MNKNIVLKSLFKVKKHGYVDEQAKLERYGRYFEKLNRKTKTTENDLIKEIHAKCSENPSIDIGLKSLVDNLYAITVGDGVDE